MTGLRILKIIALSFSLTILSGLFNFGSAQRSGLDLLQHKSRVDIPFEMHNGLILIKLKMNGVNLNFLYDTGAENTILFKREIAVVLGMKSSRRIKLVGSSLTDFVYGYVVHNVHFQFQPNVSRLENIIVLEENIFDLQQILGLHVDGLIGGSFFRNTGVKIDYHNQVISVYHPAKNRMNLDSYTEIPVIFNDHKPYISAVLEKYDRTVQNIRLLVDTGSSIPLILHANVDSSLITPDHLIKGHIGIGISGALIGTIGIVKKIGFSDFSFEEVITSLQDFEYLSLEDATKSRHGIIGNDMLNRFTVYIDYSRSQLFLKPGKKYNKSFVYDKSGLIISAVGLDFNQYFVQAIVPGSAAEKAGLLAGDEILSVNRISVSFLSLNQIQRILKRDGGTRVRIKISRQGKTQVFDFLLEDMLLKTLL